MGESSGCLVRSFSVPSPNSSEEEKGNPLHRALTTSISFGRFATESLDWEKWSAFSHNRYMEEVERYSKPGSVAEKKAYFEAHYKKRRAEALLEQEKEKANTLSERNIMNKTENNYPYPPGVNLAPKDIDMVVIHEDEMEEEDVQERDECLYEKELEIDRLEKATEEPVLIVENPAVLSNELENDGNINMDASSLRNSSSSSSSSKKKPRVYLSIDEPVLIVENHSVFANKIENDGNINMDASSSRNSSSSSSSKKKPRVSLSIKEPVLIVENHAVLATQIENDGNIKMEASSMRNSSSSSLSKKKPRVSLSIEEPVLIVENHALLANKIENDENVNMEDSSVRNSSSSSKKKTQVSLSKLSTNSGISKHNAPRVRTGQSKNSSNMTPKNMSSVRESSKKMTPNVSSLHTSINFASCSGKFQKAPSLSMTSKNSALTQTLNRSSVNVVSKSAIPPPEKRRTVTNSRSRIMEGKMQVQSLSSSSQSNISSTFGSKARSNTVSSSFSFRSEERVALRKEKLEQKMKTIEADKQQVHAKAQNAKPNPSISHSMESSSSNLSKKVPTTTPFFPKFQGKASLKVQDNNNNNSRPPWRFSTKTDDSKDVTGMKKRPPLYSAKSKLSNRENASPNIQL